MTRPVRVLLALLLLLLAGCGGTTPARRALQERYGAGAQDGDTVTWSTADPVDRVVADLVPLRPAARARDGAVEHLRFDDDIVVVAPEGVGSRVRVEDLDGPYEDGAYAHLGPGFDPGSPSGDDGGPGDAK